MSRARGGNSGVGGDEMRRKWRRPRRTATLPWMLIAALACGPRPAPVVAVTSSPCFFASHPLALSEKTGAEVGRAALRGELGLPPDFPMPSRVRMWLSGHRPVKVSGLSFAADSVPPGRYELVTSVDGLATRYDTLWIPVPPDSTLIVSLARRSSHDPCGFIIVRDEPPRPWWQFWRRRR